MRLNRILLSAALVVVALVVQVSVLARLQLPGAVPDLLLLDRPRPRPGLRPCRRRPHRLRRRAARRPRPARRPRRRALRPRALRHRLPRRAWPSPTTASSGRPPARWSWSSPPPSAPPCCTRASAPSSATPPPAMSGLGSLLFTAALYDLLLAPFVVPLIMALARRAENDPLADESGGGERPRRRRLRLAHLRHRAHAHRQPARRHCGRQGGQARRASASRPDGIKGVKRL